VKIGEEFYSTVGAPKKQAEDDSLREISLEHGCQELDEINSRGIDVNLITSLKTDRPA
jgi:hypothetical protein